MSRIIDTRKLKFVCKYYIIPPQLLFNELTVVIIAKKSISIWLKLVDILRYLDVCFGHGVDHDYYSSILIIQLLFNGRFCILYSVP